MARDFHILALSGGGFRGLYTATVLDEIEKFYRKPLAQAFDLICGTSIGGILALGVASEISAEKLKNIFIEHGSNVFKRNLSLTSYFVWSYLKVSLKAAYSQESLKNVLLQYFEDKTIGDLKHRVLIPTVNCAKGKGQFLKTPHHPSFKKDYRWSLVDASLATSAAPTYFPIFENDNGRFIDGGVVGNSPSLFGYHEAKHFLSDSEDLNIRILSIGTANQNFGLSGSFKLDAGFLRWKSSLFDILISAQEGSANYVLGHLLGSNFYQINAQPTPAQSKDIGLDKTDKSAVRVLTELAMTSAQDFLGSKSSEIFLKHRPATPIFYHGPNQNNED